MLKLKTKWFNKWAKKNSISDNILLKTLEDISKNLNIGNYSEDTLLTQRIYSPQSRKEHKENFIFLFTVDPAFCRTGTTVNRKLQKLRFV